MTDEVGQQNRLHDSSDRWLPKVRQMVREKAGDSVSEEARQKIREELVEKLEEMDDDEVIEAGYCSECYSRLRFEAGCKKCPNGCLGFCG